MVNGFRFEVKDGNRKQIYNKKRRGIQIIHPTFLLL